MASSFNLSGRVILEGGSAIATSEAVAKRLENLSKNGRTTAATLKATAQAMDIASRAAKNEAAALSTLTIAQQKANAVQRESLAASRLTRARAGAVTQGANDKSLIAEGQAQLAQNRAITETIRQRIAVQDAEGRSAVRSQQLASAAVRDRVAQERLALAQQREARAAEDQALRRAYTSTERSTESINRLGTAASHTAVVAGAAFVGLAANAIVMEKQFAAVVRTSDIVDTKFSSAAKRQGAIDSLRLTFDSLAQQLPITYKELTEIGTAANQLGIPTRNLGTFTKTVAQFSATTGVSVDTTATALGRLSSLIVDVNRNGRMVGGVGDDFQGLADSINKVGVNSVATDQQIINIASQIAGVSNAAGLGYKDIVGFSGALASVSISPYLARGLTTRLFTDIGNAVSDGGRELTKFATTAGMSAEEFSRAWRSDPQQALLGLFSGIRKAGPDAVNVLKNLGVTSVLDQPALIRLANAADSTGKAGALLAQTFRDANTAIGENAKQYAVIANTVQARLQVALNRVQILLRNIGEANIGPLGDTIDSISNAALKLSQNLDKPVKLLGSIELPFTQGEALGALALATGLVAAFTLVVAAISKVYVAFVRVREGASAIRGAFGSARAALTGYTESALAAASASNRLAASQRAVAATRASATLANNAVSRSNSAFGGAGGLLYANYANAASKLQSSNNRIISSFGNLAQKGTGAVMRLSNGLNGLKGAAARAGGAISGFLGGPIGIAVTVLAGAVAGLTAADAAMRKLGSGAGDMSLNISKATDALEILQNTKVSGAVDGIAAMWDKSTKSFFTSTKSFKASLADLGSGGFLEDFSAKFRNIFDAHGDLNKGFNYTTMGLDKINEGFKNLADSGNTDAAISGIQKLFKGMSNQEVSNALAHMSDVSSILTQKLNENGIAAGKNGENLIRLAKSNSVLGAEQARAQESADELTNAFHGDIQAAQDYINATKDSAAAALDLNKAFQDAGKGASLGDFFKQAKEQYNDFVNFTGNVVKIAAKIGPEYLNQLSALNPQLIAQVAKGGNDAMDKLKTALDRKDVLDGFQRNIGVLTQNPRILESFGRLGADAQKKINESLGNGDDLATAFSKAGPKAIAAFNAAVAGTNIQPIPVDADTDPAKASIDALSRDQATKIQTTIYGDAGPAIVSGESARDIIANLKAQIKIDGDAITAQQKGESAVAYIGRLQAILHVLGDDAPARAKGESAAHYIGALQALIHVQGDPAPATKSAGAAATAISRLRSVFNISGNPIPARRAGETARQYVNRLKAILQVTADTAAAMGKGRSAKAQISQLKAIIDILGDNVPARKKGEGAKSYIDRLKGTISILGNNGQATSKADAAVRYANGKQGTIRVGANTSAAEAAINAAARTRYASIVYTASGRAAAQANDPAFFRRAGGGPVWGKGTATSDSIPAMLSNGEYVIRAKQAQKYRSLLDAINFGIEGFASGGRVTGGSAKYQGSTASVQSAVRSSASVYQVTELSAYDRHLLQTIADNIGVSIAPDHIAGATTTTYRNQSRRGNG